MGQCLLCNSEGLIHFLSLGKQPPSDAFLKGDQLDLPEPSYPLDVFYCPTCHLVQLGYIVDPTELFKNYVYETGSNQSLIENFHNLVEQLIGNFHLKKDALAVDIGSNDGTLLKNYLPHGIRILGIDPSSVAEKAKQDGVPTTIAFFSETVGMETAEKYGRATIITAMNVFAHVQDVHSFVGGVSALLDEKGVFVSESHYLGDLINEMQWDAVYHEHLRYYSLRPLMTLMDRHGLEIFHVEHIATHGGSVRFYAAKKGIHPVRSTVNRWLQKEEQDGLNDRQIFEKFGKEVDVHRKDLLQMLQKLKEEGNSIVGIGAPAKGNTLLNSCGIGSELLDYLAETSALKIGTYSPGMHIPVVDEKRVLEDQPPFALILSWNIADIIIKKLRQAGYKGTFILPAPAPHLLLPEKRT